LERAFRIFEKQSEVDFFINKNARAFLQEQFKLWSYQYFWDGAKEWDADRVNQVQILRDIAFKIIDFISQFEDELVKIWNKPKFVKNSNYVITLDRIADKKLIEKIKKHKNYPQQSKEWNELGIDKDNPKAPIDTKYFKDLELEILGLFDDLDKSLDGWLIKSENYQALNTILPKFKEKAQTIYIDPPFNTGDDFDYVDRFQDSSWISLMYDRIKFGHDFLSKEGNFFYHIDRYAYYYSRMMFNSIFDDKNFKAEIAWDTSGITGFKPGKNNWVQNINYIIHFAKDHENNFFKKLFVILEKEEKERLKIGWLDLLYDDEKDKYYIEKWNSDFTKKYIETENKKHPIGMVWNDIYSFLFTQVGNNESFFFNTQKPEHLLRRMIQSSTQKRDLVMDYFAGIGTSLAAAHKLNRRWLGIEMGDHFNTFYESGGEKKIGILGRMKIVLGGDQVFKVFGHPRHPQLSRNLNWQGGGFFKYYELEQYEEALANCKYEDNDLFNSPSKTPYQEYVFMKDEKMLKALEIDYEKEKVTVNLGKLYPNIDIAETLSNLTGKWVKKIGDNYVEFEDGTKINTKDLDYKFIKTLIWC
jgi:adenine specific DNA methylase Mod